MSGSLTLRVLATDQNVFDGSADEVILPSTTGQLGILPGHISLLTAIDVGANLECDVAPLPNVTGPAPSFDTTHSCLACLARGAAV